MKRLLLYGALWAFIAILIDPARAGLPDRLAFGVLVGLHVMLIIWLVDLAKRAVRKAWQHRGRR